MLKQKNKMENRIFVYIHSQGITNMQNPFPSTLVIWNEYYDIELCEKKNIAIIFWPYCPALTISYYIIVQIP